MIYELATTEDLQSVYDVVQHTIKTIYPKYYPLEVVDFFSELHSKDAILKDIENGDVGVLRVDGKIIATGCFVENHITRVYVLPEHQKKGYGTFIVKNIEDQICGSYDRAYLDASLPAAALYEKLGFSTIKHERYPVENGVILVYEVMEKELCKVITDITMQYPRKFRKGDKVAIVSLSSGMLGEEFCSHNIEIGVKRLKEYGLEPVFMPNALKGIEYLQAHPEARAKDLKEAFLDESIAGIICAIGGDDTYRLLPYLMEDEEFIKAVEKHPKLFTGFSDTTVNHLMFYKMGLSTYYGPTFICDLGEIADEMLPYTKKAFEGYLEGNEFGEIISSDIWYEEREDFSRAAIGTERKAHKEERGYELLQGSEIFQGELLGGCLESFYDILINSRYEDEKEVCERYGLFPDKEEWRGKILFIETCEEKPAPKLFEREVILLKEKGVFDVVNGVLVGKPQDEAYYKEYKDILIKVIDNEELPIVYNVNFGHATPRCALQYGAVAKVDMKQKKIFVNR